MRTSSTFNLRSVENSSLNILDAGGITLNTLDAVDLLDNKNQNLQGVR